MKHLIQLLPCLVISVSTSVYSQEADKETQADAVVKAGSSSTVEKGELLFSDQFDREEVGKKWIEHFASINLQDGKLVVKQPADKHPAIARHEMPLHNNIFEFDLEVSEGSKRAVFVLNADEHICHVSFAPRKDKIVVSLKDYADPKNIISKMIDKKDSAYKIKVILSGPSIEALVDGVSIVTLNSPTLDVPKSLFQFTGVGSEVRYDNVRVWKVK